MHRALPLGALPCADTKLVPLPCRGDVCCGQEALSSIPPSHHALQIPMSLCLTAGIKIQRDVFRFLPVNWGGSEPDGYELGVLDSFAAG